MKITANEDFKLGYHTFEAGNSYHSEKYPAVTEADWNTAWQAGWCEIEGRDKAPERKPGARRIEPDSSRHKPTGG